ncbi:MAG: phosphoglycerate kinase [Candidatus Paceibacterota bacterium]
MKTLRDIQYLEGVRVLLRVDFNVPVQAGAVTDDFRIRKAMPTIDFLRSKGAKVIMMSHLESIGGEDGSLEPVAKHLERMGAPVMFVRSLRSAGDLIDNELKNGQCMLLENLRQNEGEKANDLKFAKELASLADIYVNDAFSVSHREHASIAGVPKFLPSYAGLGLEKEVKSLSLAFDPGHPFLFILGGAKFETKLPLLTKFLASADAVFVGGALSNDFFKARGYEVGVSLVSKGNIDLGVFLQSPKLLIPVDITNQKGEIKDADALSSDDKIMDSGPKTMEALQKKIDEAKFILWNGPLGLYEDGYRGPTVELARMIGEVAPRGATTIIGGGDTLAAVATLGIEDKFTFVSTGGGAMLDFLAKGTLPGIEALDESKA